MSRFPPLSFLLGLLLPSIAAAQGVDTNRWVPNGPVYAVQQFGSTTFIGGEFTMLSPPTGAAVSIQTANEFPATGYPKVVGRVYAVIPDQSGGWILGGIFSSVGGQPRNNIARVNSDYSVNAWNPNANGPVYALQLSFVGTVYAGGDFTSIGGQSRSRLAELDLGAGNATTSMTIGVNGPVRAFTWNNNSVYAVGDFTTAAGIAQNRGCSINVNTRGLSGWNPNTNGPVFAIRTITRPGPVTTILIGGQFTTVGGQPRNFLAETNAGGGAVAAWNPSPNHWVRAIETRLGVAYVGGEFTTIAGAARNHAAAIDVNGLATSWNPNVDGPVHAILNNAANVAVGGTFENIGGQPFTNLARIDATTGVPAAWNPKPNGTVRSIVDNTSTIYVGGDFSGVGGVVRKRLAAYDDITGSVAPWNPGADSTVWALGVRKYGPVLYTVYAGGIFSHVGGFTRAGVAAIHPKTGVPTAWTVPTALFVQSIATTDSEVVLGGTLDGAGTRMAAVPHAGGAMTAFTPAPSGGPPMALAVKGDTVYVGHSIGIARYSLASHTRISEAAPYLGSVPIRALCVKGDFIYVGGEFTMVNAVQFRPYLIRIRGNGQVDGWNPNVDGIVRAITAGETGMLIGGDFKNAGGAPRAAGPGVHGGPRPSHPPEKREQRMRRLVRVSERSRAAQHAARSRGDGHRCRWHRRYRVRLRQPRFVGPLPGRRRWHVRGPGHDRQPRRLRCCSGRRVRRRRNGHHRLEIQLRDDRSRLGKSAWRGRRFDSSRRAEWR